MSCWRTLTLSLLCNEARGGFQTAHSFSLGSSLRGPFISATNPPFADSQGKVNRGNSAVVALHHRMLRNFWYRLLWFVSHGDFSWLQDTERDDNALTLDSFEYFYIPLRDLTEKVEESAVHGFHALVASCPSVKNNCCTSVEQRNRFKLLI